MSSDGGGLYFRKRKTSSSWVIRRTRNKIASFTTIGRFPVISHAAARKELDKFGSDSADDKTVADLLNDWFDQNESIWKRREQTGNKPKTFIHLVTLLPGHVVLPQREKVLPMSPE